MVNYHTLARLSCHCYHRNGSSNGKGRSGWQYHPNQSFILTMGRLRWYGIDSTIPVRPSHLPLHQQNLLRQSGLTFETFVKPIFLLRKCRRCWQARSCPQHLEASPLHSVQHTVDCLFLLVSSFDSEPMVLEHFHLMERSGRSCDCQVAIGESHSNAFLARCAVRDPSRRLIKNLIKSATWPCMMMIM